ncbi:unnamed protein product [Bemisia tabaci]|uniref:Spaetzle domain-containing protein n=1 Tax=Bemisia tabaci TaxID=7038 RepID=A0A9P0F0N8_BEMTA|nr:unnamed protein product [Bemisia tabaci]
MLLSILWRVYMLLWVSEMWSDEAQAGGWRVLAEAGPETSTRSAKDLLKEHRAHDILPTIPSIRDKPFSYKPFVLNKFHTKHSKNKTVYTENEIPAVGAAIMGYMDIPSVPGSKAETSGCWRRSFECSGLRGRSYGSSSRNFRPLSPERTAQENSSGKKSTTQQQSQAQPQGQSSNVKQPQPTQAVQTTAAAPQSQPQVPDTPRPACAREMNFCMHTVDYPDDRVHDTIDSYYDEVRTIYNELHQYSAEEFITDDNVTHKFRHKGHFVCESEVAYIRIGWALNWKNKWMIVINTDKYPQSVRIETCKYPNGKCEYLPPCYKSMCIQRQMPVKLLAIDPNKPHHRPMVDVFQIPTSCACFVENFQYNSN